MKNQIEERSNENIRFAYATKEQLSAERLFQLADLNYVHGSPWSQKGFEGDLLSAHTHYVVAHAGEEVIGYIGYHQIMDEAEITNVVVDQRFQHRGVASRMMERCVEKWLSEQVTQAFLEVRKSNQPAIKLYQKLQFTIVGERKQYYVNPPEDALIMQWNV